MTAQRPLKILAVGSRRGAAFLDAAQDIPDLQIVGMVDINEQRLLAAAKQLHLDKSQLFGDLEDALRAVEADILVVATPTVLHYEHTMRGLRAGLHVLCEKPLTHSRAEALAMRDEARRQKRHLNVVQNVRFGPQWRKCRELIASGLIGRVAHIDMVFRRWRLPGGLNHAVLFNHGTHHIDIIRSVLDVDPVWVRAVEWDPPWPRVEGPKGEGFGRFVSLIGLATNGCMVSYHGSYGETGHVSSHAGEMRIVGDKGALEAWGDLDFHPQVWHYRLPEATGEHVERRIAVDPITFRQFDQTLLNNLVQAIRTGRPAETDVEDNLKTLEWLFLARESIDNARNG